VGGVRAFHLSQNGERVAVVRERAPISEFGVKGAQNQSANQPLERAHVVAQAQIREQAEERGSGRGTSMAGSRALARPNTKRRSEPWSEPQRCTGSSTRGSSGTVK
jgi:hypothetical protein